jgi:uncharacterized protein (TIGR00725 family)
MGDPGDMYFKERASAKPLKVGVYGSWRQDTIAKPTLRWAHGLGAAIGAMNHVLVTGGSGGVLLEARRGCREAGGLNIGIIPEGRMHDEVGKRSMIDVVIPTGQGALGRIAILTQTVDLAFAVGGGGGTLAEVTMTYLQKKVTIVVDGLQRLHDPDFSKLLSRCDEIRVGDVKAVRGWIDSKSEDLVSPVYMIDAAVAPRDALSVGLALASFEAQSGEPSTGGPLDE